MFDIAFVNVSREDTVDNLLNDISKIFKRTELTPFIPSVVQLLS
jgi:hypothetical protein